MQPQGPFAQIDTRLANETLEVLEKGNAKEQQRAIEAMRSALGGQSGAVTALSAPAEEWERIAEKTREDYLDGFKKAVARVKSRQK